MVLQPSDERRRSGSHYTPRALTEPIVRTTLGPILERLGAEPHARADPRPQGLRPGDGLGGVPRRGLPPARRRAGRGLARPRRACRRSRPTRTRSSTPAASSPSAASTAWTRTRWRSTWPSSRSGWRRWRRTTRSRSSTTRCGTAIRWSGSRRQQIAGFHWKPEQAARLRPGSDRGAAQPGDATQRRRDPRGGRRTSDALLQEQKLAAGRREPRTWSASLRRPRRRRVLRRPTTTGSAKERLESLRDDLADSAAAVRRRAPQRLDEAASDFASGPQPVVPFHWEIEFPEVFDRENPGFDAIVGNPPFAGKNTIIDGHRRRLSRLAQDASTRSRTATPTSSLTSSAARSTCCASDGAFGLIATNTIGQGDTRSTGLRWICKHGGDDLRRDAARTSGRGWRRWSSASFTSRRDRSPGPYRLDGREVPIDHCLPLPRGRPRRPGAARRPTQARAFMGSYVLGMGFTFDDTDTKGVATPIAEMQRADREGPAQRGADLPLHRRRGGQRQPDACPPPLRHQLRRDERGGGAAWPDLMAIVEEKVKPERMHETIADDAARRTGGSLRDARPDLYRCHRRAGAGAGDCSRVSQHCRVRFLADGHVSSRQARSVSPSTRMPRSAALQSRAHEVWARFFASSMKDDLRYTPSDCFETFPFPEDFETQPALEAAGKAYYEFRAALMVRNNEGLTKTYNRFHDPDERSPDILKLRELHAAMDRAVLDAYGWTDLQADLRVPARLRGGRRRGRVRRRPPPQEALALPLARRLPRRSPRPPPGTEPPARRGGTPERRRRRGSRASRARREASESANPEAEPDRTRTPEVDATPNEACSTNEHARPRLNTGEPSGLSPDVDDVRNLAPGRRTGLAPPRTNPTSSLPIPCFVEMAQSRMKEPAFVLSAKIDRAGRGDDSAGIVRFAAGRIHQPSMFAGPIMIRHCRRELSGRLLRSRRFRSKHPSTVPTGLCRDVLHRAMERPDVRQQGCGYFLDEARLAAGSECRKPDRAAESGEDVSGSDAGDRRRRMTARRWSSATRTSWTVLRPRPLGTYADELGHRGTCDAVRELEAFIPELDSDFAFDGAANGVPVDIRRLFGTRICSWHDHESTRPPHGTCSTIELKHPTRIPSSRSHSARAGRPIAAGCRRDRSWNRPARIRHSSLNPVRRDGRRRSSEFETSRSSVLDGERQLPLDQPGGGPGGSPSCT